MPHTPRLINDALYVLLSGSGELIKVDIEAGKFNVIKKFGGYVRGMVYYKGFLFAAIQKSGKNLLLLAICLLLQHQQKPALPLCILKAENIVGEIKYQNSVEEKYDVQVIANTRPGMVNFDQQEKDLAITLSGTAFWGRIDDNK